MRALATMVLLGAACGSKQDHGKASQHKAAVDRYANADMQRNWAVLWTGKRPYKKLTPDAVDAGNADWVVTAMSEHVIPRMSEFIDAASKVTVPQPMLEAHAMILGIATEYRLEGKDMLDAATANDPVKFKTAHARMLETTAREARWQVAFDKVLADAGVVLAEVPQLAERPAAKPYTYCGDTPCPCANGESAAKLGACTLTSAVEINGKTCAPGTVRFRADGTLRSCMFAADDYFLAGEATFHPNGSIASAVSNLMAAPYAGVSCDAGPARWFEDGTYEACTLRGETTVAAITVPKGSAVFAVFHPGGRVRYVKFGTQEKCLDLAQVPYTPCIAPSW